VVKSFFEKKITQLKALELSIQAMMHLSDEEKSKALSKFLYAMSNQPAVSDVYVNFERGTYFDADKTEKGKLYGIEVFLTKQGERKINFEPPKLPRKMNGITHQKRQKNFI